MKEIKFNKKTKGNEIIVDVELPRREWKKDPIINFSNSEMVEYLANEGIKVEDYEVSSSPNYLTSYSDKKNEPILQGTWTFKKKSTTETKKVNKTKTRAYNKSKDTQKTGD
tara:strand:+ start:1304 stop:1636 length:333 start_codon:yes stop_codon:yes gene_type:complete